MISNNDNKPRTLRIWMAGLAALAALGLYIYFYVVDPFPVGVSDLVTSLMNILAASLAALFSTLVWRRYGKATPPRGIWLWFSLALWGWTIAEALWLYEYRVSGDYSLGPADVFWVGSYAFFLAAIYRQYTLIYRPARRSSLAYAGLSILAVLAFTYLYARWLAGTASEPIDLVITVNAFYVVGDLALAVASLLLVFHFRDGALGRPWIGLVVFVVSDFLYAWLETNGLYSWSIAGGNLPTAITDITYFAAYLVIAFGCYLQWVLLAYGPRLKFDAE